MHINVWIPCFSRDQTIIGTIFKSSNNRLRLSYIWGAHSFLPSSHHLQASTSAAFTHSPLSASQLQLLTVSLWFPLPLKLFKGSWYDHTSQPIIFLSVQFSRSVMSDSLRPHGLQHARPPCPSPTPGVHSNLMCIKLVMSCNHLVPFSSCLQSFPASGSFQMSQFFASGGQSIGVSASASVLPMNSQN